MTSSTRRQPVRSRRSNTKAPWGSITREQVVSAAIRSLKGDGYENVTIRSLAADLGVAPMTLYRHVRDKDDLLDEVVDRLLAREWRPRAKDGDWLLWISEAAERFRHFLVKQPAALHVYLNHPVVSPASIERMNTMIRVLQDALGEERAARRAYAALHTYTIGFAALESSRAAWVPESEDIEDLAHQLSTFTTPAQFTDGLRCLLQGIAGKDGEVGR